MIRHKMPLSQTSLFPGFVATKVNHNNETPNIIKEGIFASFFTTPGSRKVYKKLQLINSGVVEICIQSTYSEPFKMLGKKNINIQVFRILQGAKKYSNEKIEMGARIYNLIFSCTRCSFLFFILSYKISSNLLWPPQRTNTLIIFLDICV